jgi:hypothetical protein
MLQERLNPTATLLYYWLQNHHFTNQSDTVNVAVHSQVNLQNFRVWSGEFLDESISPADLDRSVARLEELGLLRRHHDALMLVPEATKTVSVRLQPLPKTLWRIWHIEHYLALGGLAIASAILLFTSGFLLVQNAHQTELHPNQTVQIHQSLD